MVITEVCPAHMLIFLLQRYFSSQLTLHRQLFLHVHTKLFQLKPSLHMPLHPFIHITLHTHTKPFYPMPALQTDHQSLLFTSSSTCTHHAFLLTILLASTQENYMLLSFQIPQDSKKLKQPVFIFIALCHLSLTAILGTFRGESLYMSLNIKLVRSLHELIQ